MAMNRNWKDYDYSKILCSSIPLTVGGDPEIFLYDTRAQEYVSAHDLIPGTKKKPWAVPAVAGVTLQADGTAAEINIDPSNNKTNFIYNTATALAALDDYLTQTLKRPNLQLALQSTVHYKPEYFKSLPDSAKELGCDPDYNAYTGKANPRPTSLPDPNARTGAGHVTLGWRKDTVDPFDPAHFDDCMQIVRMMDLLHDILQPTYESKDDEYRRQLYGARGAFRPKPFGVEYRTPSNRWLSSSIAAGNMYDVAVGAFIMCAYGFRAEDPATAAYIKTSKDTRKFTAAGDRYYLLSPDNMRIVADFRYPGAPSLPDQTHSGYAHTRNYTLFGWLGANGYRNMSRSCKI